MITIKEEFLNEEKTKRAIELGGYAAVVMWLALKSYAAREPTNGYIPDHAIELLQGAPKDEARAALKALVECGLGKKDGTIGAGLVEKTEFGWQLHNYLHHAESSEKVQERRKKERERKQRQRDVWTSDGSVQTEQHGTDGGTNTGTDSGTGSGTPDGTDTGTSRGTSRVGAHACDAPARPQPSPALSPGEREDPPPQASETRLKRADPFADSLTGRNPERRPDVQDVHEAFKRHLKQPHHKFRAPFDVGAKMIAEAIDIHGVEACLLVAEHAPFDEWVTGKADDKRTKHNDIEYIYGNSRAFNRILHAAHERSPGPGTVKLSAKEVIERAKGRTA